MPEATTEDEAPMEAPYGTERSDSSAYTHYLSGWCPGCGRRRETDGRCANCDPWWTSPLFQLGVPAVLLVLFVLSSAAALLRPQTAKRSPDIIYVPVPTEARVMRIETIPATPYPGGFPRNPPVTVVAPPETVISAEAAAIQAARARAARMEQARRQAEYADSLFQAQMAARAQQEYAMRNQALNREMWRTATEAASKPSYPDVTPHAPMPTPSATPASQNNL